MKFRVFPFLFIFFFAKADYHYIDLPFEIKRDSLYMSNFFSFSSNEIKLKKNAFLQLVCKLYIGSNNQAITAKISTNYNGVWVASSEVTSKGFNSKISKSLKKTNKKIGIVEYNTYLEGNVYEDTIQFSDYKINNFPFILTKAKLPYTEYQASLGLGYLYNDSKFSFLEQLYEKNLIDNLVFYVKYNKGKNGVIRFGELPSFTNENKYRTCELIDTKNEEKNAEKNNRWECKLHLIYFEDEQGEITFIHVNNRISFNISANILSFPYDIFMLFIKKYLFNAIKEGKCSLTEISNYLEVECNEEFDPKSLGRISFVIGKWTVSFEGKEIYRITKLKLKKLVIVSKKDIPTFIFGSNLFNKYTVIFDKKSKKVGLYNEQWKK